MIDEIERTPARPIIQPLSFSKRISPFVIVLLLLAWGLLVFRIGHPWVGHQDENGAWISAAVRNYAWYGFDTLNGMIAIRTAPLATPPEAFYINHPPLIVWLATLLPLAVGYDEALIRFITAACTLLSAALLYALAQRWLAVPGVSAARGRALPVLALAFFLFTPMILYFGRMPDHEALAILGVLLFFNALAAVIWPRRTERQWYAAAALCTSAVFVVWSAWGGLVVIGTTGLLAFIWFAQARRALLLAGGAAVLGLGLLWAYYGSFVPDLFDLLSAALTYRSSNASLQPGSETFNWADYAGRQGIRLLTLLTPSVLIFAVAGAWQLWRLRQRARGVWVLVLGALSGAVLFVLIVRNASYIHDYYLLYITVPVTLLAALGCHALWQARRHRLLRSLAFALAVFWPVAALVYLGGLYQATTAREPILLAQALHTHTTPDTLIVSDLPLVGIAINFYAQREIVWGAASERFLELASRNPDTVYLNCLGESEAVPVGGSTVPIQIPPLLDCTLIRTTAR
jgi:4-amino-4-deoxy-L-arabinose transferase-like glycosyltransferase